MKRLSLFVLVLAAAPAVAQDMPLSQVLIDGEGWRHEANVAGSEFWKHKVPAALARRVGPGVRDAVTTKSGDVYYTTNTSVYRVPSGGEPQKLVQVTGTPSGITITADGNTLTLGNLENPYLTAWQVKAIGKLANPERYFALGARDGETAPGGFSLTTDRDGRTYAATAEGVQIFDPIGRLCGVLLKPSPAPVTAVAFIGPGRNVLAIVCGGKVFTRKVRTEGLVHDSEQPR